MGRVKGLLFLLSPIFHCHKIKDGGYSNITNTNKVSPTQNTPALQATSHCPETLGVLCELRMSSINLEFATGGPSSLKQFHTKRINRKGTLSFSLYSQMVVLNSYT